ncbi:hypothetical protein A9Q99_17200 [Gammaproteobacteria bacterium 45_16_T64]|nr:hypothetical protein A9Q99_17200 [Gammaproteobacteria bacterium 45_16_T64]
MSKLLIDNGTKFKANCENTCNRMNLNVKFTMTLESYLNKLTEYGCIGAGQGMKSMECSVGFCELIDSIIPREGKISLNVAMEFINGVAPVEHLLLTRTDLWGFHNRISKSDEVLRSVIRVVLCCLYYPENKYDQLDGLINAMEFCCIADKTLKDEDFLRVAKGVYLV